MRPLKGPELILGSSKDSQKSTSDSDEEIARSPTLDITATGGDQRYGLVRFHGTFLGKFS